MSEEESSAARVQHATTTTTDSSCCGWWVPSSLVIARSTDLWYVGLVCHSFVRSIWIGVSVQGSCESLATAFYGSMFLLVLLSLDVVYFHVDPSVVCLGFPVALFLGISTSSS
jgi:hypothetical protein